MDFGFSSICLLHCLIRYILFLSKLNIQTKTFSSIPEIGVAGAVSVVAEAVSAVEEAGAALLLVAALACNEVAWSMNDDVLEVHSGFAQFTTEQSHTCSAEAGLAALAVGRRGSRAERAALVAAAAEVSAVPEGVFGWATEAGSQGPEVAPPAAGSAVPGMEALNESISTSRIAFVVKPKAAPVAAVVV